MCASYMCGGAGQDGKKKWVGLVSACLRVRAPPNTSSPVESDGGDYSRPQRGSESSDQYCYHHSHCRRSGLDSTTPVDHYCSGSALTCLQEANVVFQKKVGSIKVTSK